jgi:Outer membrane protein beta-barrel domain
MRKTVVTILTLGALASSTREAAAQWTDRGYINFTPLAVEQSSSDLNDTKTYILYDEPATTNTASSITSGNILDFGAGVRIWRNLSVGAGYHQESNKADVAITGTVPNPIFFNRPRQLNATATELRRKEMAGHLQFGWMVPVNPKLDVHVIGGPSWFRLEQDVVSDVRIGEVGLPFTEVVAQPTVENRKKSVAGFNLGADVTYMFLENDRVRLGAGGFIRYSGAGATVFLMTQDVESDVGGLQFGFGVRFRF